MLVYEVLYELDGRVGACTLKVPETSASVRDLTRLMRTILKRKLRTKKNPKVLDFRLLSSDPF